MAMIVDHYRKVATAAGLYALGQHIERDEAYIDGKPAPGKWAEILTHPENRTRNEYSHYTPEGLIAARRNLIESAGLSRKPQRNAAAAIELVVSASPEFFKAQSASGQKQYFATARKWIEAEFGKDQVLSWAVHYDETSPHMHVLMVPLTHTKEVRVRKDGKDVSRKIEKSDEWQYSSSRFLGGPKGLIRLHDELAKALAPFGVERGLKGSNARHTDQREWARDLAKREKALAAREAKITVIEKAASAKLPTFTPKIEKKTLASMLMIYTLSDGKEVKGWEAYAAGETALQATKYAKAIESIASAAQVKAAKYEEAATKKLPLVEKQLSEVIANRNAIVDQVNAYTPAQLRALANQREAEKARAQEQRRDRDNYRGR